MQFTFEYGEITGLSSEERRIIDDLMLRYSSAKRPSFARSTSNLERF